MKFHRPDRAPDVLGATAKFQSPTFKVARFCVRKRQDPKGAVGVEWGPSASLREEADV